MSEIDEGRAEKKYC